MLGIQCKMARAALGWGVRDLAAKADVSPETIVRLERGEALRDVTLSGVRSALEKGGVIFIGESVSGGIGVRLGKPKKRKR